MKLSHYRCISALLFILAVSVLFFSPLTVGEDQIRHDCYEHYANEEYGKAHAACVSEAESGDMEAVWVLSRMYFFGRGVEEDRRYSLSLASYAAENGNARAQFDLGGAYEFGEGVDQSYEKAMAWYKEAAAQGHSGAIFEVGTMYDDAQGVVEDHHAAFRWYRSAAEKGHEEAQWYLALMFQAGEAVQQSYERAYLWGMIAERNGNVLAKYMLEDVKDELNVETQAMVLRVVQRCLATDYRDCGA